MAIPAPPPTDGTGGGGGGSIRTLTDTATTMGNKFEVQQKNLQEIIDKLDTGDPQYLFKMSQAMTKWSLSVQTQSQMMKEFSDALKGIIQKM